MVDLKALQKEVIQNKLEKGFNTKDINMEFNLAHCELSEAYEAYLFNKDDLGEEFADVVIYILGLSELLGVDLEKELINKIEKNKKRRYIEKDGKWTKIDG